MTITTGTTHVCFFSLDWKQNPKEGDVSPRGEFETHSQDSCVKGCVCVCVSPEPNPPAHGPTSLASRRQGTYYQRTLG